MKNLALIIALISSTSAFACLDQAVRVFEQEMQARRHDNIQVYPQSKKLAVGEVYETYGTVFSYDIDVEIFEGTSEFMSGFGVEAIIMDPKDCTLIELVQVYAE